VPRSIVVTLGVQTWRDIDNIDHRLLPYILNHTGSFLNSILNDWLRNWRCSF
jgi:hypothetical protein